MGFVAPYLALVREDAPQRRHDLREVFNAARWIVHTGAPWRWLPHDLPPWDVVYAQTRRWLQAGVFAALVADRRTLVRVAAGRAANRARRSSTPARCRATPESGARAGVRRPQAAQGLEGPRGGRHPRPPVGPARHPGQRTGARPGRRTGAPGPGGHRRDGGAWRTSTSGYTGEQPAADAAAHGIRLEVVKLPEAKHGFVLLPRRWVVERDFAWTSRFRRLARDYERLPQVLAGLHFIAFACLMLHRLIPVLLVRNTL